MSPRDSITLGDLAGLLTMLEIACRRCDRRGLLRLDRLIEEHGVGMGLPVLGQLLARDCPYAASVSINDRCGVHFPQLPGPIRVTRGVESRRRRPLLRRHHEDFLHRYCNHHYPHRALD